MTDLVGSAGSQTSAPLSTVFAALMMASGLWTDVRTTATR